MLLLASVALLCPQISQPLATTNVLSVTIDLPIPDFCINGVIQHVAFVTVFFHLVECFQGSTVFLFGELIALSLYNVSLYP